MKEPCQVSIVSESVVNPSFDSYLTELYQNVPDASSDIFLLLVDSFLLLIN